MYPTREVVEAADQETLGRWLRFLPSPGTSAIEAEDFGVFQERMKKEAEVLDLIMKRFKGWTPELSKKVGF